MSKILIYILLAVLVLIFLSIIHSFYKRLTLLRMFYSSLAITNKMGIVIAVSGAIRAGKSTLTSGLTHLYTFKIRMDLKDKLNEIETILHEVNFKNLTYQINLYEINLKNFYDKIDYIIQSFILYDSFDNVEITNNLDENFFDYLNYQDKFNLLKEYIYCFLHLNRRSYVFSNIKMFNHITSSYALEMKNEWLQLKNDKDFPFIENSIIVEDDKLIYDSNIGYMKKLNEDSGTDLFYRLFGHLFKEKSYYLCTVQDVNRWIKQEREIAQTHIYVFRSSVVGNFPKINKFINFYESIINIIYSLFSKFYKNEEYFNNSNWFKKRFYKILLLRKKLFSKSFVYYETGIYSSIDNVGKEIKDEDSSGFNFNFVLPVAYVFGTINTHEFNIIYDHLYNRSNVKYSDLSEMEFNEDEILYVLKKSKESDKKNTDVNSDLSEFY